MRFTYAEAMTDATYYQPLAQAAEAAGYSSMTGADSLVYPRESDSTYPYTEDGDREFPRGQGVHRDADALRGPRHRDHDALRARGATGPCRLLRSKGCPRTTTADDFRH